MRSFFRDGGRSEDDVDGGAFGGEGVEGEAGDVIVEGGEDKVFVTLIEEREVGDGELFGCAVGLEDLCQLVGVGNGVLLHFHGDVALQWQCKHLLHFLAVGSGERQGGGTVQQATLVIGVVNGVIDKLDVVLAVVKTQRLFADEEIP